MSSSLPLPSLHLGFVLLQNSVITIAGIWDVFQLPIPIIRAIVIHFSLRVIYFMFCTYNYPILIVFLVLRMFILSHLNSHEHTQTLIGRKKKRTALGQHRNITIYPYPVIISLDIKGINIWEIAMAVKFIDAVVDWGPIKSFFLHFIWHLLFMYRRKFNFTFGILSFIRWITLC